MNRREILGLVAGTLAIPNDLLAVAHAAHQRIRAGSLQVLSARQSETIATIAELIIPETDTPGARAARVPEFIELMLAEWCDDEERQRVAQGIGGLDERTRAMFGKNFASCSAGQQSQLLTALDAEVARLRDTGGNPSSHFFHSIKRLTLVGYFTSEVGATAELHYQVNPGRYEPCYPLEP